VDPLIMPLILVCPYRLILDALILTPEELIVTLFSPTEITIYLALI
jgi:hypothetical protein